MATTGKIKLALIGAGGMGRRWFGVITKLKLCDLVVVVDVDLKKATSLAQQIKGCEALSDWRLIFKKPEIQAVVVATPHNFLALISEAILKTGRYVLCEKPGGVSSREIRKVIKTAERQKVNFMVSFNHRFHPAFLLARKLFDDGKIGKILFIRARYGFGGRADYNKEWRFNKKISGGGELIDQGVHMIDLARWFLGDIKAAKGFCQNLFWKSKVEDNAFVLLKSKDNSIASIHASWTNWKAIHNFEIYGTKGYLVVEGLGRKYGDGEKLIWGMRSDNFSDSLKEKIFDCDPNADASLERVLEEFVSAIKEKRRPNPNGEDAYEVLKIVEKVYDQK